LNLGTLSPRVLFVSVFVCFQVINLRSIRPLDTKTICDSVVKTSRLVTVEDGWGTYGVGAEISAAVMESYAFDHLDAPVERVCGADVPMPYAKNLETAALPQVENIVSATRRACFRNKA
jgi:pyruvate dehydrogenase E1 component beta subunit